MIRWLIRITTSILEQLVWVVFLPFHRTVKIAWQYIFRVIRKCATYCEQYIQRPVFLKFFAGPFSHSLTVGECRKNSNIVKLLLGYMYW